MCKLSVPKTRTMLPYKAATNNIATNYPISHHRGKNINTDMIIKTEIKEIKEIKIYNSYMNIYKVYKAP